MLHYPLAFGGFHSENFSDLFARLRRMPFVEDLVEGHHFDACAFGGIDILLDGNEANTHRRVLDLYVVTGFNIVTGKTAQILDDDRADLAALDHSLHPLKVGAVEIRAGVTVVCEEHGISYPIFVYVLLKNLSLILYGITLHIHSVVL